jgi:hypothetical protein
MEMKMHKTSMVALAALAFLTVGVVGVLAEETPAAAGEKVSFPGTYVRVAYNEEGWVTLGFRLANNSVGDDWMLLQVGLTVQGKREKFMLHRDNIELVIPGPKVVPLASQKEFGDAGSLVALNNRAEVTSDNINYFPADARQGCRINFFTAPMAGAPRISKDQVELSYNRACGGRLFFKVPGGIQYGTYNLNVKFDKTTIRVPFEIMTKDGIKKLEEELKKMKKK